MALSFRATGAERWGGDRG